MPKLREGCRNRADTLSKKRGRRIQKFTRRLEFSTSTAEFSKRRVDFPPSTADFCPIFSACSKPNERKALAGFRTTKKHSPLLLHQHEEKRGMLSNCRKSRTESPSMRFTLRERGGASPTPRWHVPRPYRPIAWTPRPSRGPYPWVMWLPPRQ